MKKILFSFVLMAFCFLIFPGMTVSAAKSYEAPNGESYANYYYYKCTYQNQYYEWKFWTDVRIASFQGHSIFMFPFGSDFHQLHTNGGAFNGLGRHYITCNGSTDNFPEIAFYIPGASQRGDDGTVYDTNMPILSDQSTWQSYLKGQYNLPVTPDSGTYDPEIGYLQDLEKNFRLLQLHSPGANTAADVDNRVFHFGWSSVTSTGFNLLNNEFQDIRIQVCVTPEAVFRSLFGKVRDLPLGQQKYYDFPSTFPANLLSLDFSVTDLQNDVLSEWFEYLHESQGLLESFNWKFKTYLRVLAYDGTDWYHGGWSQIILNQYVNIAIDSDTEFGVTVSGGDLLHQDSHENPDYDPWVQETDSLTQSFVVGVGSSKEEALNDSYNKYLNSDSLSLTSDNFLQVLISLSKDVGQAPSLLKELFGYLPEYVFSCLGVVIVALCILRLMGR